MGDTVATTENGYERVTHIIDYALAIICEADRLIDAIEADVPATILTALCADTTAVGLRLKVFAMQYEEELKCISIDLSSNPTV